MMESTIHPGAYVTSAEAARALGVKLPTLYAYASRGLLRSVPSAGGKARLYARSDVDRLRARSAARSGHGPVAAGALRWGEPVLDTAISSIDANGPWYRGRSAVELARSGTPFEGVAEWLWSGEPPEAAPEWRADWPLPRPAQLAAALGPRADVLQGALLALPLLSARDPGRLGAAAPAERERGRRLLRWMAASFALGRAPERAERAMRQRRCSEALAHALGGRARDGAALEPALVLCADHELNASTFAVRVAASAGADLYACLLAGLATLSGPRHGGMTDRVEALVEEIRAPEAAGAAVQQRLRLGDAVPGFGHRLYPGGDPRGVLLLDAARRVRPRPPRLKTVLALADAMARLGAEPPTVDLGLVATTAALGLAPGSAIAIFALGRAAGWIAHVLEQRADPDLLRPRARYVP